MDMTSRYHVLQTGLKELQSDLLALRRSLLPEAERLREEAAERLREEAEAAAAAEEADKRAAQEAAVSAAGRVHKELEAAGEITAGGEDFFTHLLCDEQEDEAGELYLAALSVTTELGYASTLVLQQRLGITYRQAMNLVDQLEEDGLIGPAHGFRPHKALSAAYTLHERSR